MADVNNETVRCNQCNQVLDESLSTKPDQRIPCPICGSIGRKFEVTSLVKIGIIVSKTVMKAKHKGGKRPFMEQNEKRGICHDTNESTDESRIYDRANNIYKEIIKESKTGKIIHECEEDLDKHVGHGYAKFKKPKT